MHSTVALLVNDDFVELSEAAPVEEDGETIL